MVAYNIAVKISPANRGDAEDSRNIYGLFSSGAIVCGGYVDVFNRLLESIGIECKLGSVRVKESRSAHAISVVAIVMISMIYMENIFLIQLEIVIYITQ